MSNLDDLGFQSITDKSLEEGLETLRQIRQSRLTPTKKTRPAKETTSTSRKKKEPELTPEQAARLLKMLTEEKK